jgi:cobalt-precorrin-5B (C1)-methyltransferase
MSRRPKAPLKRGWTTGACATAAARAAFQALVTGTFPDPVTIRLPGGATPSFALALKELGPEGASAGIVKDAGDDPDVTHGALVVARVRRAPRGTGIVFRAGAGVGTVTLAGLALPVGDPAINPGPRAMIRATLCQLEPAPDLEVTVSIPGGEALAARTMNARLGIVGGLSILGTTGIVVPYSCSAWIASIERGVDVARAAGLIHIAAATGSTSEAGVRRLLDLPEIALIDMGDFVGGLLKYLRRHPVPRLTLAGGIAKMAKLAQGHLDLHSARSRIEGADLARRLEAIAAPADTIAACADAASVGEALSAIDPRWTGALASSIAEDARAVAATQLGPSIAVDAAIFDRQGALLAHAGA